MRKRPSCAPTVCVIVMACLTLSSRVCWGDTSEPAPGTMAFYQQKIEGKFTLQNGALVQLVYTSEATNYTAAILRRGTARSTMIRTRQLEGNVCQALNATTVVVKAKTTFPSGASRYEPCIVWLSRDRDVSTPNQHIILPVRDIASAVVCATSTGETNLTIQAWTEVPTVSFEEYMAIYQADSKAPEMGKILSYKAAVPANNFAEFLRRRSAGVPNPPGAVVPTPAVPTPPPAPNTK